MNRRIKELSYALAGILSGALWFVIPWQSDSGWALPEGTSGRLAALACSVATGVFISYLFRPLFRRAPLLGFILLPCVTVPVAIVTFSVLLWLTREALGVHFSPPARQGEFQLIVESYLFYGILGGGPTLYILALLNQYAMRQLLNRNA
jgi:hypothetical protein